MQCKHLREQRAPSHRSLMLLFHTWTQPVRNDRACQYRQIIMSNDTFFLQWQLSQERLHKATGPPEWRRSSIISLDLCAIMQCELISASSRCMQRCPHPMHVLSDVSRYAHGDSNRMDESERSARARCEMKSRKKQKTKKKTQKNKEKGGGKEKMFTEAERQERRGKGKKRRLGRKTKKRPK